MKIQEVISALESLADPSLQESYDNAGLITGNPSWECTGIICSLDATEEVVNEAISKKANMIVAHHPIIFAGLKKITGKNYVEKTIITAIKQDIAIYAIHTNLDNVMAGVNGKIADLLELGSRNILVPKNNQLRKLISFVPVDKAGMVKQALFSAGAGQIGKYSDCSFSTTGTGTFKAGEGTNPYVGKINEQHEEKEARIEVVYEVYRQKAILDALLAAHPYEEVAYDLVALHNEFQLTGSGLVGELPIALSEQEFLKTLKDLFRLPVIRHSHFSGREIKRVAICGGAGSFLIPKALGAKADAFVTADMKYHEFFDANDKLLIADIGHYESEQFTIDLLQAFLLEKFPTFAILKTAVNTNPVQYS